VTQFTAVFKGGGRIQNDLQTVATCRSVFCPTRRDINCIYDIHISLGVMKDAARFVFIIAAIAASAWGIDILRDRGTNLIVIGNAPVYAISPSHSPKENPRIGVLRPGQAVRVLRSAGGKHLIAYRIESDTGLVGWVMLGDGVRLANGDIHDT
jgi:hypothetical protein